MVHSNKEPSSKQEEEESPKQEEAIIEYSRDNLPQPLEPNEEDNEIFQPQMEVVTEGSIEGLPLLLLNGNDDDDNIDITVKQHSEPSISNPSQKCFGPCGSKDCKPPQQWEVCSNSKNSFINCSNVIGEKCQKKYGGLCRICLIAGGTTIRR